MSTTIAGLFLMAASIGMCIPAAIQRLRAYDRRMEARRLIRDLPKLPLPPVDAPDAEFEAWARQAIHIGNGPAFERTLAEIRALREVS